MAVTRINLSHGATDEYAATIALLRRVVAQRGVPLAILIDPPVRSCGQGTRHGR